MENEMRTKIEMALNDILADAGVLDQIGAHTVEAMANAAIDAFNEENAPIYLSPEDRAKLQAAKNEWMSKAMKEISAMNPILSPRKP